MFHLFDNFVTSYGIAANNRGENEGSLLSFLPVLPYLLKQLKALSVSSNPQS